MLATVVAAVPRVWVVAGQRADDAPRGGQRGAAAVMAIVFRWLAHVGLSNAAAQQHRSKPIR